MTVLNKLERETAVNKWPGENQEKINRNKRVGRGGKFEMDEMMICGLLQRQITHFEKREEACYYSYHYL